MQSNSSKVDSHINKMYEMPNFLEYRARRISELCEYLATVMNEIHNKKYSNRFWTTILKEYVKTSVNRENLMSKRVIKDKPLLLPFNSWELPSRQDRWKITFKNYLKAFTSKSNMDNIHKIIKDNDHICVGIRSQIFEEYGVGKSCPSYFPFCFGFSEKNKRKIALHLSDKESSTFKRNLIRHLPRYLIEYFEYLTAKIKIIDPKEKFFYAEHVSPFMKLLIALYVENGSKFYKIQPGGFVGETTQSVSLDNYLDIDKHLTYGWKIHPKDIPTKAYRLEEFKNKYDDAVQESLYDLSIIYNQVNAQYLKIYYADTSEYIFENIDHSKYPSILLRPRGVTKKIDNSKELSFLNPPNGVTIGNGMKPMAEIVKNTHLVVHLTHPSTNFLECVYVNHPVVSILKNDSPTDIIKPFYNFFLEVGVLHNNVESMINHLNKVNISTWWGKVIQHTMYKEFKEKFAREV